MKLTIGAKTDPGKRPNNEDHYIVADTAPLAVDALLVVADGMGGRNFGERASAAATEAIEQTCAELLPAGKPPAVSAAEALDTALHRANDVVFRLSQEDPESEGMGTTCVTAVLGGGRLCVAHAGDSRAYMIRAGHLEQITDDHSFVAEQVRAGLISEDHARRSKFRNVITRAVGIEPTIEPDVVDVSVDGVDALLLCTDGLTGVVSDLEIERVLLRAESAQQAADILVEMAVRAGGLDNITAVVAKTTEGAIKPLSEEDDLEEEFIPEPARGGVSSLVLQNALLAMMVFFVCTTVFLTLRIVDAGYTWRWSAPYLIPPPPVVQPPYDPANAVYASPVALSFVPLQQSPLSIDPQNGVLSALTRDGQVISIGPGGATVAKFSIAQSVGNTGAGTNLHMTTDPAGNLYVSNAAEKTVMRYRSTGQAIGEIGQNMLEKPGALAVDAHGSVYVIDNGRLKVIKASRVGT